MTDQQKLFTLRLFETFTPILKRLFILHIQDWFIVFLAEFVYNLNRGNLQGINPATINRMKETFKAEIGIIMKDIESQNVTDRSKNLLDNCRRVFTTKNGQQLITDLAKLIF